MRSGIQIMEKPDWVSWEEIRECMYNAHSVNRNKGIFMIKYLWPTDKIQAFIGVNGVMLVALDGKKVVGTAAVCDKLGNNWYAKGRYADFSFECVLPEYSGQGIYQEFERIREELCATRNYHVIVSDTHSKNKRRLKIAQLSGYRPVGYLRVKDHYNIIMAKWPAGCPYSQFYCMLRFCLSSIRVHLATYYHLIKDKL